MGCYMDDVALSMRTCVNLELDLLKVYSDCHTPVITFVVLNDSNEHVVITGVLEVELLYSWTCLGPVAPSTLSMR